MHSNIYKSENIFKSLAAALPTQPSHLQQLCVLVGGRAFFRGYFAFFCCFCLFSVIFLFRLTTVATFTCTLSSVALAVKLIKIFIKLFAICNVPQMLHAPFFQRIIYCLFKI